MFNVNKVRESLVLKMSTLVGGTWSLGFQDHLKNNKNDLLYDPSDIIERML